MSDDSPATVSSSKDSPSTDSIVTIVDSESSEHGSKSPSADLDSALAGYHLDPRYMEIPETEAPSEVDPVPLAEPEVLSEPLAVSEPSAVSQDEPPTEICDIDRLDEAPVMAEPLMDEQTTEGEVLPVPLVDEVGQSDVEVGAVEDSGDVWQLCEPETRPSNEDWSQADVVEQDVVEQPESPSLDSEPASENQSPPAIDHKWEFLLKANSEMLAELMDQVMELRESLDYVASTQALGMSARSNPVPAAAQSSTMHFETATSVQEQSADDHAAPETSSEEQESEYIEINKILQDEVHDLRKQLEIVEQQNSDLAAQIADENVRRTVSDSGGTSQTLTWEERKEMVLRQLEDDSFDAENFLEDMRGEGERSESEGADPVEYVKQLHAELDSQRQQSERQEAKISELQQLLQQQRDAGNDATLAAVVDADEVVQAEREKLRKLKEDWEARFRKTEIAASLERATLSRERQQLETENAKLQEKLAQLARRADQGENLETAPSRRWLAKLGISENDE